MANNEIWATNSASPEILVYDVEKGVLRIKSKYPRDSICRDKLPKKDK